MIFNFSEPITAYEFWAIVLSVIALLIPDIKWVHNRYIKKIKIDFLPSGKITLFFNNSGAYISLGGVYDTKNKPATIKDISAQVIRESDNSTLSLTWSSFPSPVFRQVAGNYETSFETAHAFKAEADTLTPAFIEFACATENMNDKIKAHLSPLVHAAVPITTNPNIQFLEAGNIFHELPEFHTAELELNDEFFWKTGKYKLCLMTKYNNTSFTKTYLFSLSDSDSKTLRSNIQGLLLNVLGTRFNFTSPMSTVYKDFEEIV